MKARGEGGKKTEKKCGHNMYLPHRRFCPTKRRMPGCAKGRKRGEGGGLQVGFHSREK